MSTGSPISWNREFRSRMGQVAYPLRADATGADQTSTLVLPEDLILGMGFAVPALEDLDPDLFHLRQVAHFPTGLQLVLGYDETLDAAEAVIPRDGHVEGRAYPLRGLNRFDGFLGHVVLGRFQTLDQQPAGVFRFGLAEGALDPDVIRMIPPGVLGVRITNAGESSGRVVGEIELYADFNTAMTTNWGEGDLGQTVDVYIHAVGDTGLNYAAACDEQPVRPEPIRFINGVSADDLTISTDSCLSLAASGVGTLRLSDRCSTPCCGWPELESLAAEVKHLRDQGQTMVGVAARLEARVAQLANSILATRTGGGPCVDCS